MNYESLKGAIDNLQDWLDNEFEPDRPHIYYGRADRLPGKNYGPGTAAVLNAARAHLETLKPKTRVVWYPVVVKDGHDEGAKCRPYATRDLALAFVMRHPNPTATTLGARRAEVPIDTPAIEV